MYHDEYKKNPSVCFAFFPSALGQRTGQPSIGFEKNSS
jgi:hypothetical protein